LPLDDNADLKRQVSSTHDVAIVEGGVPLASRSGKAYAQMELLAHRTLAKLCISNPAAAAMLHHMIAGMSRKPTAYIVSAETLARELGVTSRTIQNSAKILREHRLVQILKSGNTNVYVINSSVAWRGKTGSKTAIFHSITEISEKEQDASVEELEQENSQLLPVPDMQMLFREDMIIDGEDENSDGF
ncbi:MAG: replication/maintenance protein RepL, partial [Telluria sp.]